jgi:polyprenyl-phospho-N-acetylgalactosaminyl synthase
MTSSSSMIPLVQDATWIVIPAYREGSRLGQVIDTVLTEWPNVVVVDDGSDDETGREALTRAVWVIRHPVNLGQGAALQTGVRFALERGARFLVTFDSDGQHQVGDIPALLAPLVRQEADFALGSRFLGRAPGIPLTRKLILKLAIAFTRVLSGLRLTDAHNGLRAMSARGAAALHLSMNRMEHASQLIDQIKESGLEFVEVPVTIEYSPQSLAKGQKSLSAVRLAARLLFERITR